MKRIETLKKKSLRDNFEKKGLSAHLSDIKIRIQETDSGSTLYEKLVDKLRKIKEKEYFDESRTVEEQLTFLNDVSFGSRQLKVERVWENEEDMTQAQIEFATYVTKLVRGGTKLHHVNLDDIKEKYVPIRIHYIEQGTVRQGYSLLNEPIKKKYHGYPCVFPRQPIKERLTLYNISTLFIDALIHNSLERFILKDPELMRYLVAKEIARASYEPHIKGEQLITPLPTQEPFRSDLLKTIDKYGIKIGKPLDSNFPNLYATFYYLERNKEGYIDWLKHYLMHNFLMPEFFDQMDYVVKKTDKELKQRSEYARSYETKKHINKKTLKVMKDNVFLTKYKYVELDNEVLLDDFHAIEKEFLYLMLLFPIPDAFDHSFRVKRLGHHKAEGVYFPGMKATIIDSEYPRAYIHELGHQIDYTHLKTGELLSEQVDFRGVIDAYKKYAQQNVDHLSDEHPFKKRWTGTSKYNKSYFFDNTEIFARSLEIYLHTQGVETSFLRKSYDLPEYPQQTEMVTLITDYFDTFFGEHRPSKVMKEKAEELKKAKQEADEFKKQIEEKKQKNENAEKEKKESKKEQTEEKKVVAVPTMSTPPPVKKEVLSSKNKKVEVKSSFASSVTEQTPQPKTSVPKRKRQRKVDPNQLSIFDFM